MGTRRTLTPRLAAGGGGALVVLALALIVAIAGHGGSSHAASAVPASLPGELTGRAPWPANTSDLKARLAAMDLPALSQEGTRLHIHQHLDLFVHGHPIPVAAGIGIDPSFRFISPLHTHDESGVIHVESPTIRTFTLGEFFGVWGIRLTASCLGGYCAGHGQALRVFVDGRPLRGDPGRLVLAAHQEIVVAFGTPEQLPRPVPARYAFPAGL
jgi:hypothetical protein